MKTLSCLELPADAPFHSNLLLSFFLKFFGRHMSFSWGHWYPCFGLLVTSALGSQAKVDPFFACFLACVILRFSSGATPGDWSAFSFLYYMNIKMTHLECFHFFAEKTSQFHRHFRNQCASVYRFKLHISSVVFVRLKFLKQKTHETIFITRIILTLWMGFTYVPSFQKNVIIFFILMKGMSDLFRCIAHCEMSSIKNT